MRIFITIVFIGLFGCLAKAQNDPKSKKFINEIMTANYSNDSVYYGKNFKPNYIYADSVNGMAINMMREGMKTAKNKAFYIFRKDSVLYVNALGKKIVIKRDYASRNRKIEQIPSDSLVLTEKERVYINTEIDKMSGQA